MASSTERAFVASPVPIAGGRVVASPFQFWVTGEDQLVFRVWSALVGNVAVQGRWLDANHEIKVFRHVFPTGETRGLETHRLDVAPGFLLNCSIGPINTTVFPGQMFTQLALVRGKGDAAVDVGTILQGYVATAHWIAYPGSPIQHCFEGPGHIRTVMGSDPAAGLPSVLTPETFARYRLQSIQVALSTSAVVGNRRVYLELADSAANVLARVPQSFVHTAGLTIRYFWIAGVAIETSYTALTMTAPLPFPFILQSSPTIRIAAEGMDAGDNFTAMTTTVEDWISATQFGSIAL